MDVYEKADYVARQLYWIAERIVEYWGHSRYLVVKRINRFDIEFPELVFERSFPEHVFPNDKCISDHAYENLSMFDEVLSSQDFSSVFHEFVGDKAIEFEIDVYRFVDVVNRLVSYTNTNSWQNAIELALESAQILYEKIVCSANAFDGLLFRVKYGSSTLENNSQSRSVSESNVLLSWDSDKKQGLCKGNYFSLAEDPAAATWFDYLWEAEGYVTFPEAQEEHEILRSEIVTRLSKKLERIITRDLLIRPGQGRKTNRGRGQKINPKYRVN